jgi:ribonuclease VapC
VEAARIRLSAPSVVLDASALLALLRSETGEGVVRDRIGESLISAVNWTEVVERRRVPDLPVEDLQEAMEAAGLGIVPFGATQANAAAGLKDPTRRLGLSLADRACLALGKLLDLPVVTADRAWAQLEVGIAVEVIR